MSSTEENQYSINYSLRTGAMYMKKVSILAIVSTIAVLTVGTFAITASANHSWGVYHWARTANPFTLKLGDNVSGAWDAALATSSKAWSLSSVLDTVIVKGNTNPRTCRATKGTVQVCNAKYGSNGWLGLASVWVSGSHITQGTAKMNDTYFTLPQYNTTAWKNLVVCQEVAHTFGLGHQDEDFNNANLGTCMDYTSNPLSNQSPNAHDYEMLETIYAHTDSSTTLAQKTALSGARFETSDDPREWGRKVRESRDGKASLHERDLGRGDKVFTFVIWADPEAHTDTE